MKKKLLSLFTASSLLLGSAGFADADDSDTYYYDEDMEFFNKGKFVQRESDEARRAIRRQKITNWGIASGSFVIGAATLLFVGQNHNASKNHK